MPKKILTDYPYTIPSLNPLCRLLQADPEAFKNRPAQWVNEFFLIEALLRSEKAKQAYRSGGHRELIRFFHDHNIAFQNPLKRSHHRLLTSPPEKLVEELKEMGDVDCLLGIQDLGALVTLTPDIRITRDKTTWCGYDGEQDILESLRNSNPRFVYLRFDLAHPIDTILESKKLRRLLKKKREQFHKQPKARTIPIVSLLRRPSPSDVGDPEVIFRGPAFAFSDRQRKWTPFKDISNWLNYLKCDDLREKGHSPQEIAAKVYPGMKQGAEKYYSAIKRVKQAIKSAENGTWPPSTSRRIS